MIKIKRSRKPTLQLSSERIRVLTSQELSEAAGACDTTSYTTDLKATRAQQPGG
jgi:hypothetical protein